MFSFTNLQSVVHHKISEKNTMMIVKGKVVIITGSGQGLGKAFAQKLLEAGAKVSNLLIIPNQG